jgi:hypothetical protein
LYRAPSGGEASSECGGRGTYPRGQCRRPQVNAEDLIRELTQDSPDDDTDKESLLPLSSARVLGEFDLKHQTIKKPLEIRDCEFEGPVSLRYCEFEQVVDFSGCTVGNRHSALESLGVPATV